MSGDKTDKVTEKLSGPNDTYPIPEKTRTKAVQLKELNEVYQKKKMELLDMVAEGNKLKGEIEDELNKERNKLIVQEDKILNEISKEFRIETVRCEVSPNSDRWKINASFEMHNPDPQVLELEYDRRWNNRVDYRSDKSKEDKLSKPDQWKQEAIFMHVSKIFQHFGTVLRQRNELRRQLAWCVDRFEEIRKEMGGTGRIFTSMYLSGHTSELLTDPKPAEKLSKLLRMIADSEKEERDLIFGELRLKLGVEGLDLATGKVDDD